MRTYFWWSLVSASILVAAGSADEPKVVRKPLTAEQNARVKERDEIEKTVPKLRETGKTRDAIAAVEKMLAIELEVFGELHRETAGSLEILYELFEKDRDYKRAIAMAERWVKVVIGLYGEKHWRVKTARIEADLVATRSRWTDADRELERAAVRDRSEGLASYGGEKTADAIAKFERASAATVKLYGEGHPYTTSDLQNLAVALHGNGSKDRAEAINKKVIASWKASVGDQHPSYADALNNFGSMLLAERRFYEAKPILEEASAVRKAAYGVKSAQYAQSVNNLGGFYFEGRDYPAALVCFQEAVLLFQATLGKTDREVTNSYANISRVYEAMGEERKAYEMRLAVLDQLRQRGSEKKLVYAYHSKDVGLLCWKLGDRKAAVQHLETACEIYRATKVDDREEYADAIDILANIAGELDDPERAVKLYSEALAIRKKRAGESSIAYARSLHNLGVHSIARRDYERGIPLLEESHALKAKLLGRFDSDTAFTAGLLASAYGIRKQPAKAKLLFADALEADRRQVEKSSQTQSELGRLAAVKRFRATLDNCVMATPDSDADVAWLYKYCLAWKGAVFTRQTLVSRYRREHPDAAKSLFALLDDNAVVLARLWHRPAAEQTTAWLTEIQNASWKREFVEEEISRRLTAAKLVPPPSPTPAEIGKALPAGAALVDFWDNGQDLFAFVLRPNAEPVKVHLDASRSIAAAVNAWRGAVTGPPAKGDPGAELRKLLWRPLLPHLKDASTVLISPDGVVGQLPFGALPGSKAGTFLIEDIAVTLIPVPQMLPALVAPAKLGPPSIFASGDVAFSLATPDAGGRGSWPSLPGTKGELEGVSGTFRKAFPTAALTEVRGEKATAPAVRTGLAGARYIHLATHGFFAEGSSRGAPWAHPGVMNGLVFAGANDPARAEGGGLLTALGVSGLDLAGTELAVLSACETGLGRLVSGEGVLGLQRAFQVAGVRTTVTSLWQVDDGATRSLMERFYRNVWDKKLGKGEALREAQLWMLREGKRDAGVARGLRKVGVPPSAEDGRLPPYFWAAFVLSGDWR